MTRWDLTGIFWDDYVAPKEPTVKEKREPPEPVWLADDYLPYWGEAEQYKHNEMTDTELTTACREKHSLVWDSEFYQNFALIGFRSLVTNKVVSFELFDGESLFDEEVAKLRWIAQNFLLIGFNDTLFDIPMLHAMLAGRTPEQLMEDVDLLIMGDTGFGTRPYEFYRTRKLTNLFAIDHIDLIELSPLGPSLKISAGRIHAHRMADLPFKVGSWLNPRQIQVLRWYWSNDLDNTAALHDKHRTAIELRTLMTTEYGVDVRSRSDAQIAEQVIRTEIMRLTGKRHARAKIIPWRTFRYKPPGYLKYRTPNMQWVLDFVCRQDFIVDPDGSPQMPPELKELSVPIGKAWYQMGIGGLHSQEKRQVHIAGDDYEITDNDVTSYYPSLMLQQGMYPPNVGPEFLTVFERIVRRRIAAKRAGDKANAETLKIVINGTFGKSGEKGGHSVVYHPDMMVQVTISGQLSLLMLIERLELADIEVISANTDGIIVKCHKSMLPTRDEIMREWERDTGLELEAKGYKAVYSRDVNNYIALLTEPDPKEKSAHRYAKTVGAYRKVLDAYPLKWNPNCEVCAEAVIEYLATGHPVAESIEACTDVRKFIEVRRVNNGAAKDGEYLGKAIRWYYSTKSGGPIVNVKNGNLVPRSEGARPCMTLPQGIPADLDRNKYVERALAMLDDFYPKK